MKDLLLPERYIRLSGAVNFRDIGGYITSDGLRVRCNRVYRSDSLADLKDDDIPIVSKLGLKAIFDLRGQAELEAKPNNIAITSNVATHNIGFLPYRAVEMVAEAGKPDATVEGFRDGVREVYRRFAIEQGDTFLHLFNSLQEEQVTPALIHCTSGKDRTGFAVALLLNILGVPKSVIWEDYMLSNVRQRDLAYLAESGIRPEMLTAMMEVHPTFLFTAFEAIDDGWGTLQSYCEDVLDLTPPKIAKLHANLLEKDGLNCGGEGSGH
ncbi:MAG: tyrosine-protein phosphatase [Parasphingorhabdus sp.]|uniref:tyrosine-protein phosphatase n=1 Tax=Parasphingorhabdus sp. TaxID=2709688 RepID=UPI0030029678